MFNRSKKIEEIEYQKAVIDKKLELYKRERELECEIDITQRKLRLYDIIDKVKHDSYEKINNINIEIAKLEAKRDYMKEIEANIYEQLKQKDDEIARLMTIISAITTRPVATE